MENRLCGIARLHSRGSQWVLLAVNEMSQMEILALLNSHWLHNFHFPRFKPHHENQRHRPPYATPLTSLPFRPRQIPPSGASEPQTTTLSQHSGSKVYKPWQKEEVERPIGWIEEHVDLMQGKRSEWAERAEGVFSASLGGRISARGI